MKLFYTPVERLLLSINDPATVALSNYLWFVTWKTYMKLDAKLGAWDAIDNLTTKELRLLNHVADLLRV